MKINPIQQSTFLAFVVAILLLSCNDGSKKEIKDKLPPLGKIEPPKQTIDYKYANALEEEYKTTRGAIINKSLNIEDAREFWFDLKELKKYIAYVEQQAKEQGYDQLGIRIYNGAYPMDKAYPDPGYSTVFLVPTGSKSISKGSFMAIISSSTGSEANIQSIKAYNYGQAGRPPKDIN